MKSTKRERPFLWLLPMLFFLVFFVAFPLCITTIDSLYQVDLRHMDQRVFIGLANYSRLIQEKIVQTAFCNSLFYLIFSLLAETVLGIALALALKENFRGRGMLLAILILPWALPPLVNGIIWRLILDPSYGMWNDVLLKLGLIESYRVWLNDPHWSKWLITLVHVWKTLPLITIVFLAKLQTLPEDILEAAKMDGAGYWRRFYHIVFPFIKPVLAITLAQGTISALHLFDEAYILTGTALDTRSLLIENYLIAFREMNLGAGMALSLLISVLALILMGIYIKVGGRMES